jgi:hypothetical protein
VLAVVLAGCDAALGSLGQSLLGPGTREAQEAVSGVVLDEGGLPVAGVQVTAYLANTAPLTNSQALVGNNTGALVGNNTGSLVR